jgi:uncharacterized protein YdhG (YjbR/CyaY superfamily)
MGAKPTTRKSAGPAAKKSTATRTAGGDASKGFTAEERAAMKERAREQKALLAKIAEMKGTDRALATRIHAIVTAAAPVLAPKTWYGMPAYAKDGTILCFFQSAAKFGARYATFGFSDEAKLDQGVMWPTSWAIRELTASEEKKIAALVKKAAS